MPVTTLERANTQINGFSHEDKLRFLDLFREHRNPFAAIELLGISPSTFYSHLQEDHWFAREVGIAKRSLAWSRTPRLFQIADGNTGGNVTANIWLQKVLGGDEFNPDRRPDVAVVSVTYAPTVIEAVSRPSLMPVPTRLTSSATETRRSHTQRIVRRCHCGRRGPHKAACLERQQRREAAVLSGKGCRLEGVGGTEYVPQSSHPSLPQKAPGCPSDSPSL